MKRVAVYVRDVDKKPLQANKIKEIGHALVVSGFACLDQQANALGISRSTAWTILNSKHKTSGLTAAVINQMLMAPQLPPLVRTKLFEYIEDKIAGTYGHSPQQVRRFAARLAAERLRSNSKTCLASFTPQSARLHEIADALAVARMRRYASRRS